MAEIINIKNEAGEVQYPVTKPECVIDENGKSVLTLIQENGTELRQEIDGLSEKIDNLPQGEGFDKQGNYPLLHVGLADDLAGRGESVPASFGFRASGGKSIKDGRAYIKRIKGNSVVWNQHYPTDWTRVGNGVTSTSSNSVIVSQGTLGETNTYFPCKEFNNNVENAVYLFTCEILEGASQLPSTAEFALFNRSSFSKFTNGFAWFVVKNTTPSNGNSIGIRFLTAGQEINFKWRICQHNLTQMFQAGNEPTTIEDFNARVATLGVDLNAYNEGQVIHCNTESIKSIGDNAWDEKWEEGYYDVNNGQKKPAENLFRSVNHFRILPNNEYYLKGTGIRILYYDANMNYISYEIKSNGIITSPPNACYASIFGEKIYYSTDIMITLVHSGWKQDTDAGYQPYWQDTLPLPIIRKYFPDGMKKAGATHDEIRYNKASGKWEKVVRIGEVDMGALSWVYETKNLFFRVEVPKSFTRLPFYSNNLVCVKYFVNIASKNPSTWLDKEMALYNGATYPLLGVKDSAYTDAAALKASLQGVILYYELAEPIVTELDEADQNFRDYYNVADFGTEEAIPATDAEGNIIPSANFSADIIYQFNAVDMIREHELEITELQKVIATMQSQLASLTSNNA